MARNGPSSRKNCSAMRRTAETRTMPHHDSALITRAASPKSAANTSLTRPTFGLPSMPHAIAKNRPGVAMRMNITAGINWRSGVRVFV